MNASGSTVSNWLAGIGTIIIVGLVVSNASGVAGILNALGGFYKSAVLASQGKAG
jgi:hypothetical protein